jgi:DNA invertase Pin-like site-specific DNA recombinase
VVYLRQATTTQVEHNRESTARPYALVDRAVELGWRREHVPVIDQDLGLSGAGATHRAGFAQLIADVALGHVGIILRLEGSRLARHHADGYRLLDLGGMTDTVSGAAEGVYQPGRCNTRLVLGLHSPRS